MTLRLPLAPSSSRYRLKVDEKRWRSERGTDTTGHFGGQLMAVRRRCRMIRRKSHAVRRGRRISAKLVTTSTPRPPGSGTESLVVTPIDQLSYPETAVNELALLLSMAANPKVIGSAVAEKSGCALLLTSVPNEVSKLLVAAPGVNVIMVACQPEVPPEPA